MRDILCDFPRGSGLGASLEMDRMAFVPLSVLDEAYAHGGADDGEVIENGYNRRVVCLRR